MNHHGICAQAIVFEEKLSYRRNCKCGEELSDVGVHC